VDFGTKTFLSLWINLRDEMRQKKKKKERENKRVSRRNVYRISVSSL
jgi:hypothetical protein